MKRHYPSAFGDEGVALCGLQLDGFRSALLSDCEHDGPGPHGGSNCEGCIAIRWYERRFEDARLKPRKTGGDRG